MTFQEAILAQPLWLQIWVFWMAGINLLAIPVLLIGRKTRADALVIAILNVGSALTAGYIFETLGWVRLLGLGHLIFWTPLAVFLWHRLKRRRIPAPYRAIMIALLATLLISLPIDLIDLVRYLMGERGTLA
jgi:hypothetical protein